VEPLFSASENGDQRTAHYLENFLGKTAINQRTMNDMSNRLILREIYHDEITHLQEKIAALQRQVKSKSFLQSESTQLTDNSSDRSTSSRSTPTGIAEMGQSPGTSESAPQWDLPSKFQEMDIIIKQKDDIIRRREEEYMKLRNILTVTQTDMQSVLDLNNQYLNIIGQMNQMQMTSAATPRVLDKNTAMLELERKLEEAEQEMEQLEEEMVDIESELKVREAELDRAQRREKKYKDMLGLPEEATDSEVEEKIKQIMDEGSMRKKEVDRIQRELNKLMGNRGALEERLTSLNREKDKVEFHLRQQQLTIKKMNRMKVASAVVQSAEETLAANGFDRTQQAIKLPNIDRAGSQIGLSLSKSNRPMSQQYCMFCRTEYQPLKAQNCRLHFRPIRNGKWLCCKDTSHRGAGCLQVPHFYIEITADKKIFLTDGSRYMELS
jgi:DNA repair exonuclease SbcCD ATPase subunit